MTGASSKEERDRLLRRIREIDARLRRGPGGARPAGRERGLLEQALRAAAAEYFERLPRVVTSACPFCGAPLRRSFDPHGLDGCWWHVDPPCEASEPEACGHFQVLLGALDTRGREPAEVVERVQPGPAVPFVVPALLDDVPGMVAVVGELPLGTGDRAYPIAYFTDTREQVHPRSLHQPWLREALCFELDDGQPAWTVANDEFDFELRPWARRGKLRWVELERGAPEVFRATAERPCPFVDLPGDRFPQQFVHGRRFLLPLPTGEAPDPFD